MILVVYGLFYTSNTNNIGVQGSIFSLYPDEKMLIIRNYIFFILLEFGIYYVIIKKYMRISLLFGTAILELLLIPFYKMTPANDFAMRSSIPALFIVMIYIDNFFLNIKSIKGKVLIILTCIIAAVTPLSEINRSIESIAVGQLCIRESVYSFSDIHSHDNKEILTCDSQFFVHSYQDTIFWKYLSKKD